MILSLLSFSAIAGVAVYLGRWRAGMRRRKTQAWDTLVAQLRPNWTARELSDQSFWNANQNATPEEKWQRIQGAQGLWAMYENARVMMEMADYAALNSDSVDSELLAALRSDAMQVRLSVLKALAKYACNQVNESTCLNVSHAAAMYVEMATRTTQLLQVSGGEMAPTFAAAR